MNEAQENNWLKIAKEAVDDTKKYKETMSNLTSNLAALNSRI